MGSEQKILGCPGAGVMQNVGEVYCHVTGGVISKGSTAAEAVIQAADEHYDQEFE